MKKYSMLVCFLLCLFTQVHAQEAKIKYHAITEEAFNYYRNKDFTKAALAYEHAFKLQKPEKSDLYNAACSWALADKKQKAFKYLSMVVDQKYANYQHITSDPDFNQLHADKRWIKIVTKVKDNQAEQHTKYGDIIQRLNEVLKEDQKYRIMIDSVYRKFGGQSAEFSELNKKIHEVDSVNLIKVTNIIDSKGWLGPDEVGSEAATAIFLVIQHANLQTQLKYLPLMREAVINGKALSQNLALLEDRVLLRQGKKQIYGSQVVSDPKTLKPVFAPIEDEINVNTRRASVGLEPLEIYAKRMGFEYKVPLAK